jgi:hypothetical protein
VRITACAVAASSALVGSSSSSSSGSRISARAIAMRCRWPPEQVSPATGVARPAARRATPRLEPYTEPTLRLLAAQGVRHADVMCPGFVSDCDETIDSEIAIEARAIFLVAGGQRFHYIACLNDRPEWIGALAELAVRHPQG